MLEQVKDVLQGLLSLMNICALLYAFNKFTRKPQDTLNERVATLEVKVKDIEDSLRQGNDKFRRQEDTNEVLVNCMLAFIDFEISYCLHTGYEYSEDLSRAKKTLQEYLAKQK